MRCRCFWPFLTIAIGAIIFAQPLGPIVFRWFFQFQNQCLGMIFCGKPKNNVFYDMLTFATNCACISALGVKRRNIHSKWTKTLEQQFFYNIFDWSVCYVLWAAIKEPANYCYRQRLMVFNVTITIGAIISAQPLESIIFRWFSDTK